MLPPEKEGDGKYAHLILNRNGDFLGVKPGFNRDGTKIDEVGRRDDEFGRPINPGQEIIVTGDDREVQ